MLRMKANFKLSLREGLLLFTCLVASSANGQQNKMKVSGTSSSALVQELGRRVPVFVALVHAPSRSPSLIKRGIGSEHFDIIAIPDDSDERQLMVAVAALRKMRPVQG